MSETTQTTTNKAYQTLKKQEELYLNFIGKLETNYTDAYHNTIKELGYKTTDIGEINLEKLVERKEQDKFIKTILTYLSKSAIEELKIDKNKLTEKDITRLVNTMYGATQEKLEFSVYALTNNYTETEHASEKALYFQQAKQGVQRYLIEYLMENPKDMKELVKYFNLNYIAKENLHTQITAQELVGAYYESQNNTTDKKNQYKEQLKQQQMIKKMQEEILKEMTPEEKEIFEKASQQQKQNIMQQKFEEQYAIKEIEKQMTPEEKNKYQNAEKKDKRKILEQKSRELQIKQFIEEQLTPEEKQRYEAMNQQGKQELIEKKIEKLRRQHEAQNAKSTENLEEEIQEKLNK